VWDVARGTSTVLGDHPYPVCALAYSEANNRLLAATIDGSLYLWDTDRAWQIARLQGHQAPVGAIAISGTRTVATGDVHGRVFLWDLETREVTQRFDGHSTAVTALAFSPEGSTLVSGDRDGLVLRWTIGGTEATRTQFSAAIEKIAFDDENQRVRLLTGGRLATLDRRQAETPPGEGALLMTAAGRPVRCDWTGVAARWGNTLTWLTRPPMLRVIDLENRTGMYLHRFRMRSAPPRDLRDVRYSGTPREKPWSD